MKALYMWEYRRQRRMQRNPVVAAWIAFWWALVVCTSLLRIAS